MSIPSLTGVHIFVRDMAASMAFYRLIGLEPEGDDDFARAITPAGTLEFGSYRLTRGYDPAFRVPTGAPPATGLQFALESRDAVDEMHARLVAAGYHSALPPFDAFWGSRYCEVDDPDGNIVGFQGSRDGPRTPPPLD